MKLRLEGTALTMIVFGLAIAFPTEAVADSLTCARVPDDRIVVDGMLDDWSGIRCSRIGGTDRDRSLDLRCAYDDKRIYLSVNIRDQSIRRTKKASAEVEDYLAIRLSVGSSGAPAKLRMFPGFGKVAPERSWGTGRVPKQVEVEDTRQMRGWSAEAAIPLGKIRGLRRGTPAISARVAYHDADGGGRRGVAAFDGTLQFSVAASAYRSFLRATRLRRSDIRVDVVADVDGMPGAERVIAGGKVIGVLTDEFSYMTLPVKEATDVFEVKVVDLAGEGTSAILARYRQYGNMGSRDVVGVWYAAGSGFERALAFEVRKQLGDRVLANKWSLTPKGKHRKLQRGEKKRGRDILVEAGEARGWDEDNYEEIPAKDVKPILLPWEDKTSAVYYFQGNAVLGGDPKTGR